MTTTKKKSAPGSKYEGAAVADDERGHLQSGFGAMLRRERLASGYSLARLAELAGLWGRTISRYERGEIRPRADAITVLAMIFRRPEGLDVMLRNGKRVGMRRDDGAASELRDQFLEAIGDSIRPPLGGRGGRRAVIANSLLKFGLTPVEIEEEKTARVMAEAERQLGRAVRALDQSGRRPSRADLGLPGRPVTAAELGLPDTPSHVSLAAKIAALRNVGDLD